MTLKRFSLFILLFVAAMTLSAHRFSYPVRVVDGQEMYEYPVQKGEGLYRISVTFGVSQEDLIKYNPELSTKGLKYGQVILIPVKETHVVKKGETLYRIAKNHNLTVEQLKELNPEIKENALPVGGVLRVAREPSEFRPAAAKPAEPVVEAAPAETVVAETPTEKAVEETPAETVVAETPAEKKPEMTEKPEVASASVESDEFFSLEEDAADLAAVPAFAGDTFRLALLLPLQADAQIYDLKMERFLRFYEGVLLALREQKRDSMKFEVFVYDVGKTEYKLRKVLESPEMQTVHAIIGPAYSEQVPLAGTFAKTHHVPCLLPFTNDVDSLDSNPFLLQNNPDVGEGTKVVQFKREKDNEWASFDELMRTYFNVQTPSTIRPRYDILGYDLANYFIPASLRSMTAETEEERLSAFLAEYDGLQSTLAFRRVGEGGLMNTPLKVIRKTVAPEETDTTNNQEETE